MKKRYWFGVALTLGVGVLVFKAKRGENNHSQIDDAMSDYFNERYTLDSEKVGEALAKADPEVFPVYKIEKMISSTRWLVKGGKHLNAIFVLPTEIAKVDQLAEHEFENLTVGLKAALGCPKNNTYFETPTDIYCNIWIMRGSSTLGNYEVHMVNKGLVKVDDSLKKKIEDLYYLRTLEQAAVEAKKKNVGLWRN